MNTKSAIKHLEKCKIADDKYKYCKLNQTWDNIISLLQQGEKYKEIVNELKNDFGDGIVENPYNGIGCKLSQMIEIIGQKYFPEETNQNEAER